MLLFNVPLTTIAELLATAIVLEVGVSVAVLNRHLVKSSSIMKAALLGLLLFVLVPSVVVTQLYVCGVAGHFNETLFRLVEIVEFSIATGIIIYIASKDPSKR